MIPLQISQEGGVRQGSVTKGRAPVEEEQEHEVPRDELQQNGSRNHGGGHSMVFR